MLKNASGSIENRAAVAASDPPGVEHSNSDPALALGIHTRKLRNAEDLREATRGADLKVVQLAPGSFEGQLTHARVGTLSVSAGDFYPDIRARGVMNPDLVTIGMMIESSGDVMQWDYDVVPGDIVVFPKAVEQEGRFTGRSRYVTLTLSEEDLALHSTGERALQDPDFWTRIHRCRPSPSVRAFIRREVARKVAQLREGAVPNSPAAVEYFRRSLLEAFIVGILDEQANLHPAHRPHAASKIVRAVEDYVDGTKPDRPIHISELCLALHVPRRTLHRAFRETLGTGPMEYIRLRRLATVHRSLSDVYSAPMSVTQAALNAGFTDLGRFSVYYRRIYGESPSLTQKRAAQLP
jgi:AraC family ethanolamine operon transcriptional activator